MKRVTSHLLTKDKDSLILGRGNDVGQYINISAINKLQSISWSINTDILHLISDVLKPTTEPLSALNEQERIKSFILRTKETDDVIDYLLENGNQFWFGWKYDSRGRMYSQGYHVNPQANAYRKAMLNFHDKELLTDEGKFYLKVDIANQLGYDKEIWVKRINEANKIIALVFTPEVSRDSLEDHISIIAKTASEPELFIKAMFAWYEGVVLGNPIGHNVGLDSTASGIQCMSAMSGCPITAKNCNVNAYIHREYTDEANARLSALKAELSAL